ncbi:MAG: hypothetical protein ACJAZ1_000356 [Yoonia sp.]|jgi:hypothetical protein
MCDDLGLWPPTVCWVWHHVQDRVDLTTFEQFLGQLRGQTGPLCAFTDGRQCRAGLGRERSVLLSSAPATAKGKVV